MTILEIKYEIMKVGLKQYEVAKQLGYSETVFSKKLRNGLSQDDLKKLLDVINSKRKGMSKDVKN